MSLFDRLLRRSKHPGDLAGDEWAPIPSTAVARPQDVVRWLAEPAGPEPHRDLAQLDGEGSTAPLAVAEATTPAPVAAPSQLEHAPAAASPEPSVETPPVEPTPPGWVEVLRSYAEHLTDAELRIIRQQLAST